MSFFEIELDFIWEKMKKVILEHHRVKCRKNNWKLGCMIFFMILLGVFWGRDLGIFFSE
jgi:hypothetical protein